MVDPSSITQADIDLYRKQGYLRLGKVLSDDELAGVRAHVDDIIAGLGPDEWPERMNFIHTQDEAMMNLCKHKGLLDAVQRFIGPNIVLFASQLLCKPGETGHEVPWHQDGIFWPLEPMKILTVWLAIDDASAENGCMRVIPSTHTTGPLPHEEKDTSRMVLHLGMDEAGFDASSAVDIELPMGAFSLHEP